MIELTFEAEVWSATCPKCKDPLYTIDSQTHMGIAIICINHECNNYWVHEYRSLQHANWVCKEMH